MKQVYSLSSIWLWIFLLSHLQAQEHIPTLNFSEICPALVTSPDMEYEASVSHKYKTVVLPLADNRAVVFPCQLKIEKTRTRTGSEMSYFPDQSVIVHYINITSNAYNYSTSKYWTCKDFITFQPDIHLDIKTCNFLTDSNYMHSQFVFWSNQDDSLRLHLNNYDVTSGDGKYLQIYMTSQSDNSHSCRVQQYDLTVNSSTSCQSNNYKSRRYCAQFSCSLFREEMFQSLLNTTHTTGKLLKVSEEEIIRVIVATICPILIVCLLVLLTCVIVACCRVSEPSLSLNEEETTKTSLECR